MDVLVERGRGPRPGEDEGDAPPPPPEASWRSRTDGAARALAWLGVGFGALLLVAPGLFALRDVREWRAGLRYRPRLAWGLGGMALWAAAVLPWLLTDLGGFVLIIGVVTLPIVVRVAARPW